MNAFACVLFLRVNPHLVGRISRISHRLGGLRRIEDALLGRWMRDHAELDADHRIWVDLAGLPLERAGRLLNILLQIAAGRDTPPRRENLLALTEQVQAAAPFSGATLAGAWIRKRRGRVSIEAEPSNPQSGAALAAMENRFAAVKDLLLGEL